ncbi:uncharacterized protein LOC124918199 [Impatiens glandulifera]|uniref:uncharacterized protein LOC124918199 n=1 Tax=Impatiens glandulifera TaxID=253017 RepID=UPI001FB18A53|nr:uncharacterized protein LOC124918199 [Impatiens glandulifera]
MASSTSPQELAPLDSESQLSSLLVELSQQVQEGMSAMVKMINDVDDNSNGVMEDIQRCKDNALEKKKILEDKKDNLLKAAFTVMDMINNRDMR